MNYSQLLNDFMDRSLPASEEETLFRALASDEELRFELKYLLSLQEAIRNDDEASTVPVSTTRSVFQRLGYAPPVAAGLAGNAETSEDRPESRSSNRRGWAGYAVALMIGGLLTFGGTSVVESISSDDASDRSVPHVAENVHASHGATLTASSDELYSTFGWERIDGSSAATVNPARPNEQMPIRHDRLEFASSDINVVASIPDDRPSQPEQTGPTDNTPDMRATPTLASVRRTDVPVVSETSLESRPTRHDLDVAPHDGETRIEDRSFVVEVRGSTEPVDLRTPVTSSVEENNRTLNNASLGLTYDVSDKTALCFELGRESYLLQFDYDPDADGQLLKEMRPTVTWGAAGIRHDLANFGAFSPYGQVMIGASGAGFMTRGALGMRWDVSDRVGITGRADYSRVLYRFLGDLNSSERFGISYGVSYRITD